MSTKAQSSHRRKSVDDEQSNCARSLHRPKMTLEEQQEYDEWRRERGSNGRKRRDLTARRQNAGSDGGI